MSLGKNLKSLREQLDMSQLELGEKVGVSQEFISQLERGLKTPRLDVAERIASALDVTIDDLLKTKTA